MLLFGLEARRLRLCPMEERFDVIMFPRSLSLID